MFVEKIFWIFKFSQDEVGVNRNERAALKKSLYGSEGVSSSEDKVVFEHRLQQLEDLWIAACETVNKPNKLQYFQGRLKRMLTNNFETKSDIPWVAELGDWCNNNCESMNHVLKNATEWHLQPLSTLVTKLKKVNYRT